MSFKRQIAVVRQDGYVRHRNTHNPDHQEEKDACIAITTDPLISDIHKKTLVRESMEKRGDQGYDATGLCRHESKVG